MKPRVLCYALLAIVLIALVGCSVLSGSGATPTLLPTATAQPASRTEPSAKPQGVAVMEPTAVSSVPAPSPVPSVVTSGPTASAPLDPFDLVSQEQLFAALEDLTAIQPYSGWRNSASQGEAEALDYVAGRLTDLGYLQGLGLEVERQSFHVFLGTELWETRLYLTVDGREIEVPANGLRGPRDNVTQALRFDSDGALNDSARNPVMASGPAVVIRSAGDARHLDRGKVQGQIVLLDYAVIDRVLVQPAQSASIVSDLLEKGPAGIVLITTFSNQQGESHGSFVGDIGAFDSVQAEPVVPVLYARLEDLAPAGIESWDDLARVEGARLTWDADVSSPANSGNLVAHIPGADPAHAVILGAHIDSPNTPGAMDDGSGSAILLEVARVLDAAQIQPPVDLYLVWFGSEELGLYGSAYFAATHQELLDRTLAMLQTDMLSRPLDGLTAELKLVTWSYSHEGNGRLAWPDYLGQVAARHGVDTVPEDVLYVYSDNDSLAGFDVPQADLIYEPPELNGSVHYAAHIHDPYDTVDLAREMGDVFGQMARVALAAALDTGRDDPSLRVTPPADRRALFVASHTEPAHMTPSSLTDVGMALSMAGWDVDLIPYGQALTQADLQDAGLVVALPPIDYAGPGDDSAPSGTAWLPGEIDALQAYVADGGLLVLANSAHRLKYGNQALDDNEDWSQANALAGQFGVTYQQGFIAGSQAWPEGDSPLLAGVKSLDLSQDNGVPFDMAASTNSQVLAGAGGQPAVALLEYGQAGGQVLVLADLGILGSAFGPPHNLPFWQNLAQFARER